MNYRPLTCNINTLYKFRYEPAKKDCFIIFDIDGYDFFLINDSPIIMIYLILNRWRITSLPRFNTKIQFMKCYQFVSDEKIEWIAYDENEQKSKHKIIIDKKANKAEFYKKSSHSDKWLMMSNNLTIKKYILTPLTKKDDIQNVKKIFVYGKNHNNVIGKYISHHKLFNQVKLELDKGEFYNSSLKSCYKIEPYFDDYITID